MPLVEEVASKAAKATHGWAYVPDTGYDPSKAAIVPAGTKRFASGAAVKALAAAQAAASTNPTSSSGSGGGQPLTIAALHDPAAGARANTQLARRLAELDRDGAPGAAFNAAGKSGAGRAKGRTPATRKILAAQKTFVNYLADEEALAGASTAASAAATTPAERARRQAAQTQFVPPPPAPPTPGAPVPPSTVPAPAAPTPAPPGMGPGAEDDARLVAVAVPRAPGPALLARLTGAAPLAWGAARARADPATDPPRRYFCEWCGYWGTVRCRACGARVCGLECYQVHGKERCVGL